MIVIRPSKKFIMCRRKWKKKNIFLSIDATNTNIYNFFLSLIVYITKTGNAQTQVELSVPSSLSLGKAPLTISCRSLKTAVINRIQIERKPATGSVYSTLVYVGEGFTPTVRDGKENDVSLVLEQIILRQINSFLMLINITILEGKILSDFFYCKSWRHWMLWFSSLSVFSNSWISNLLDLLKTS